MAIALCLISYDQDIEDLKRCLKSCTALKVFDEIVITDTSKEPSDQIKAIVESYGGSYSYKRFEDDFSAVRNFNFDQVKSSSHILWCFTPETRVHTEEGLKPISEIEVGDRVLTHTGLYKRVIKLYRQPYDGDIKRLSSSYSMGSVGVTPNHEFYAHKEYQCRTGVKFCKPDCEKQYSKRYLKKYGKLCRQCKQGYTGYNNKFIPASDLLVGDIVTFPRLRQSIFTPYFLDLPENDRARNCMPDKVEVTPDLMRLIGYYVAEGTTGNGQLSFCFHAKESEYHADLLKLMKKFFGIEGKQYFKDGPEGGGCTITFYSAILSKFFHDIFCGLQPTRRLPVDLLGLSDQHLSEFIRGYYRGDGGENPDSFVITTSSPYLVEQCRLILTRFGIMAECIPYKTKAAWKVRVGGKSILKFEEIIAERHSQFLEGNFNKNFYSDAAFMYHQIGEYTTEQYTGDVYNLEVEDDHTYVTEYMISHNCDSDDIITPVNLQRILDLKSRLDGIDTVLMDYLYARTPEGEVALKLPRERLVRNRPDIRWHDPIHEYLPIEGITERHSIAVDHMRSKPFNPDRNLKILKESYSKQDCSERQKFYYGKELFDTNNHEEGIKVLESYIVTGPEKDFPDNLCVACIKVAQYYALKGEINRAKVYSLKGVQFNPGYAENLYMLGSIAVEQKQTDEAIEYFKQALSKNLDQGMSQIADFYSYLPAKSLAQIYSDRKDYAQTRKYATIALSSGKRDESLENFLKQFEDTPLSVAWLVPGGIDITNGSFRIRRWQLHKTLPQSKIIERYLEKPFGSLISELSPCNVIVWMNFCEADLALMRLMKSFGKVIIFDDCEAISGYPYQTECMQEADEITCCSTRLAEIRSAQGCKTVSVIPDPYEPTRVTPSYTRTGKLRAGFFGMGGNSWLVKSWLKDAIDEAGYELVVCTEWDDATVRWDINTWPQEMQNCDVILCPQRVDVQPAKSHIKLLQAMSMGLPCIASPLPAYLEIAKHGENCLIASDISGWKACLIALQDPVLREIIGKAAKATAEPYSAANVSKAWQSSVQRLIALKEPVTQPQQKVSQINQQTVDIIIPVYNGTEYLKLCLDSINLNTTYPYRVILSDAGSTLETWEYYKALRGITVLGEMGKRLSFSEACNAGIRVSTSKYFVILNSDVIVSKGWLDTLVKRMGSTNRLASCGVLSNCNMGWTICAPGKPDINMQVNKVLKLHPGMKIDQVKPHLDDLQNFMTESNAKHEGTFVSQDWIAAYCTIFARCAVDEVGLFDPIYKNGCEDLDLMRRLTAFGYKTGEDYGAFVYHFGGITRGSYEKESVLSYRQEDVDNHIKYREKWYNKRVAIHCGMAWEPWNHETVEAGMGGSETWATYLARALLRQNYNVTVYGHLDSKDRIIMDGNIRYVDHRRMEEDLAYTYVNLFISSRSCEPLKQKIHALKTYVMIHDIWLSNDPNYDIQEWRVAKYLYLSTWHKEFLMHHHKIPEGKLQRTSNGVMPYYTDVDRYHKCNQTCYSSSPDRGLYQLLMMLPEIRKHVPDFQVIVAYGFFNWESAAKARNDKASMDLIVKIKSLMKQPGVKYVGRVSKEELAHYEKESKVWLYPTWFSETQCITCFSARHAECAIVTTDLAGLKDTGGGVGVLLPPDGLMRDSVYPESYTKPFIEEAVKMLTDESYRLSWVEKGKQDLDKYSWDKIASDIINS